METVDFSQLLSNVRNCQICKPDLKDGVRPVLQVNPKARVLIAGQAPGSKVHATGIPFDDPSGDRLRVWMGIDITTFYDSEKIGILPMAFCYPGKGKSGDLPPRKGFADLWHPQILDHIEGEPLVVLIGMYAQNYYLEGRKRTLTETVSSYKEYLPDNFFPLPHPSPRNNIWMTKNEWFKKDVLPILKKEVEKRL